MLEEFHWMKQSTFQTRLKIIMPVPTTTKPTAVYHERDRSTVEVAHEPNVSISQKEVKAEK